MRFRELLDNIDSISEDGITDLTTQNAVEMTGKDDQGNDFAVDTDVNNNKTGTVVTDQSGNLAVRQPGEKITGDKPVNQALANDPAKLQKEIEQQKTQDTKTASSTSPNTTQSSGFTKHSGF